MRFPIKSIKSITVQETLDNASFISYTRLAQPKERPMKNQTTSIQWIKTRLANLEKERVALLNLLEIYGEGGSIDLPIVPEGKPSSFSLSGRIVDAVIELVHKKGRPAKNSEIYEFLQKKGVPLGNADNPERMLSAILSNETKKKGARLRKAARGYFDIRQ